MLEKLNKATFPLEKIIKKYRKYIGYFFLLLSLLSFGFLLTSSGTKESGEKAILVLWIILWLPICARVCDLGIAKALMPLRKELGILMGTLAVVHMLSFSIPNPGFILTKSFWISGNFLSAYAFGFFALILTIPLLLTSSTWAIKKLGKKWKILHMLVYIIVIFTVIHVVLIKAFRGFEVWPVIVLILYFIGKTLEWKGVVLGWTRNKKSYPKWQKWICPPCGHLYDPTLWDADSGILPGTEFGDIPYNWQCPECGVKKSDFVPYDESVEQKSYEATIIAKDFLNPTTLELSIEMTEEIISIPWQFVRFLWEDTTGKFSRQYSIAKHQWRYYTFIIKLTDLWRGAQILRAIPLYTKIRIGWVFGNFYLQEGESPKVFLATGTGLAPIYSMIVSLPEKSRKSLYFSVATEAELFYAEKLRAIKNLDLHIHITREKVGWYEEGRVDIDSIEASRDTEWYLCGNPKMVAEAEEKLSKKGFTKVYSEEFL